MLDKKEVNAEIELIECRRDHDPTSVIRLASLYTIRDHLDENAPRMVSYSLSPALDKPEELGTYGDSDFLRSIAGKDPSSVWLVMDELMDTLKALNPRVYESVLRKVRQSQ